MWIFKLTWNTWSDTYGRKVSDFALPKELGYFKTIESAERMRDENIKNVGYSRGTSFQLMTSISDYTIERVYVHD